MKVFGTDYDGVIINIEPQKAELFGALLNKYWGIDNKTAAEFWIAKGGTSRKHKFDYLYEEKFGRKLNDFNYIQIENEFSKILKKDYFPNIKILDGAIELLNYCRSKFDKLFVTSGIPIDEINYLVEINGLSKYFDEALGTNEEFPSKKEHFNKIVKDWKPNDLVFIADSPEDMKIAKEFTNNLIGMTSNHPKEELIEAGATKTTSNLKDALALIETYSQQGSL